MLTNIPALIWIGIIAFGIIMYVILDGFDLGIGILFGFFRSEHDRDIMISTILPVWDGNETWLVFGGAALYGAFPLAFSTILPAIYIPLLIMSIALVFRGIAFEFRLKAKKSKQLWDGCFFIGSLLTAIVQGLILGTFIQGFKFIAQSNNIALYQWLNPFSIFCAVALLFGYVLLGSNRLIAKTQGRLQEKCFIISEKIQYLILAAAIIVSVWSPFLHPSIKARWFNSHNMPYLAILPVLGIGFWFLHYLSLRTRKDHIPFWSSIGIFLVCYIGFIISVYPYIVPRKITYLQAAAASSTLNFMTVGAAIMLPILLFYTLYAYKIFKGKVIERVHY